MCSFSFKSAMSTLNHSFISSLTLGNLSNQGNLISKVTMHSRPPSPPERSGRCIMLLGHALQAIGGMPIQQTVVTELEHLNREFGGTINLLPKKAYRLAGPPLIGELAMPDSRPSNYLLNWKRHHLRLKVGLLTCLQRA